MATSTMEVQYPKKNDIIWNLGSILKTEWEWGGDLNKVRKQDGSGVGVLKNWKTGWE